VLLLRKQIRYVMKAISWRLVATATTICITFAFTGSVIISSGVGVAEFFIKILVYYLHERLWDLVPFSEK